MNSLLLWIPLLPLLGFLLNGLFGRRLPKPLVHWIACGATGASFLLAAIVFQRFLNLPERLVQADYFRWIESGDFAASFGFLLDPLSMVMTLVVTGVGFLIHVYSIGYMWAEAGYYRFFAYMNLFMFAMLMLVLADNYLLLFLGWEGVGLCSYLLIGFYFHKPSAAAAGKKAFIVNRIGDFGFVVGLVLLFVTFRTLDFRTLFAQVAALPVEAHYGVLTAITLLFFVGATGKSAQIPLYVWLPDAMEGPTPVSALIHAATMVTAGVYMVVRSNPLYGRAPETLFWVGLIGALTAVFAATIGLFQRDIKRVLAYSTVSQLGYMFVALGVGAYATGIFHLMTHAFFKALLFLGSGSVILALHHEQDMQAMGGLRKYLPVTAATMWIGALAIAGVPPLAGFFSKDEILWHAFAGGARGHLVFFGLATLAAGLTAFYMFRLVFLTFHGRTRVPEEQRHHVHESPRPMTAVLVVLALLAAVGGFVGLPAWLGPNTFRDFLQPVFAQLPPAAGGAHAPHSLAQELAVTGAAVLVGLLGIAAAWLVFVRRGALPDDEKRLGAAHRLVFNKYYVDELYDRVIVRPLAWISEQWLWKIFDAGLVDGLVNGAGAMVRGLGDGARRVQNGLTRTYLGWVAVGAIGVGLYVLFLFG
ncbi:MAG TPA: NADH-quinone oxidoreductase subunit L [Acidobacteriota bacterium]|nr:NADH-quinone oxidoreductase subunit L [Acidobacteriota bacterium]HPB26981.1 NADH-quinone oxidoreductase subunit L [Acidobacteriota bacterium]HQP72539.1 NADH-quinone oxidoreductase subunit L [Acidobacteriota bacterium]